MPFSFITLLAYDHRFVPEAIRSYYSWADEIILGLDRDRLTWSKNPFELDLGKFQRDLALLDPLGKIRIIEENFHRLDHPMDNETEERNQLSLSCRPGNWIVQIDADECAMNFAEFADWIEATHPQGCLWARTFNVFKIIGDWALVIEPCYEGFPVATRLRWSYAAARNTSESPVSSPLCLLHHSFARSREEIRQKLTNWGHAREFDTNRFLELWDSITLENYQQLKNFHPLTPETWPALAAKRIGASSTT
jgi:hypothetical protein